MPAPTYRTHPNCKHAVLAEDFIITARETSQPFVRVRIDGFRQEKAPIADCPLVYMPAYFMMYPLLEGDGVQVFCPTDSPTSFTLYSVDFDLPTAVLEDIPTPASGTLVSPPSPPPTLAVQYFSKDFYIAMCDGVTVIVSGDARTIYTADKVISLTTDSGSYEIKTGTFMLEAKGLSSLKLEGIDLESTGKFIAKSNNIQLKAIVAKLFEFIGDLYTKMGTFDAHTHVTACAAGPGSANPTLTPTGATAKAAEVSTFDASNTSVFFQE